MPRIDRILAHNLGLSRRVATRLFRDRRVTLADGTPLTDPTLKVAPSQLPWTVRVDDDEHSLYARYHVLQHKPVGVVTALRDGRHPTARGLLGEEVPLADDLRAVGRLDLDASGLLLWTTDGALLHRLTHPRYAIPRTYQVALAAPFALPDDLGAVVLDDGYRPAIHALAPIERAALHPGLGVPDGCEHFAEVTISTGVFHEVKRIFAALGSSVVGLCRVRYGGVELPEDLAPGEHRAIDLHALFAGIHPRPPAPGESDDLAAAAGDDDDDDDDDG